MKPRPVNREINNEFSVLGLPFNAVLLVMGVIAIFAYLTSAVIGMLIGTAFFFVLRRLLHEDDACLEWIVATLSQKTVYGPRRSF